DRRAAGEGSAARAVLRRVRTAAVVAAPERRPGAFGRAALVQDRAPFDGHRRARRAGRRRAHAGERGRTHARRVLAPVHGVRRRRCLALACAGDGRPRADVGRRFAVPLRHDVEGPGGSRRLPRTVDRAFHALAAGQGAPADRDAHRCDDARPASREPPGRRATGLLGRAPPAGNEGIRRDVRRPRLRHERGGHVRSGRFVPVQAGGRVTSFVGDHGLLAVFVLMFVAAVLPAASELTMIYGGALASGALAGQISHFRPGFHAYVAVVLVGAAANVLGAVFGWALGRYGGHALLERRGRWIHATPERIERAERWFDRFGMIAV